MLFGGREWSGHKKPDRIIRARGRDFQLYSYIVECDGQTVLDYPNFAENPEYTDEGRPFKLPVQDECPLWKASKPDEHYYGDCGSCKWFHRDEPLAANGVCICDELQRTE